MPRREANPGASRALIRGLGCEISVFLISFAEDIHGWTVFLGLYIFYFLRQHIWTLVHRSRK
jgi:hypothetical protein